MFLFCLGEFSYTQHVLILFFFFFFWITPLKYIKKKKIVSHFFCAGSAHEGGIEMICPTKSHSLFMKEIQMYSS